MGGQKANRKSNKSRKSTRSIARWSFECFRGRFAELAAVVGSELAHVLTGGSRGGGKEPIDEQYLLDLEREVFVSLAGEEKSQARMAHMLKTGKPLRN